MNLYNSEHKTNSDAFRRGYDAIRWNKPRYSCLACGNTEKGYWSSCPVCGGKMTEIDER